MKQLIKTKFEFVERSEKKDKTTKFERK